MGKEVVQRINWMRPKIILENVREKTKIYMEKSQCWIGLNWLSMIVKLSNYRSIIITWNETWGMKKHMVVSRQAR